MYSIVRQGNFSGLSVTAEVSSSTVRPSMQFVPLWIPKATCMWSRTKAGDGRDLKLSRSEWPGVLVCEEYSPPRRGGVDATSIKMLRSIFYVADGLVRSVKVNTALVSVRVRLRVIVHESL